MKDTNDIINLNNFRNRKQEEKKRKTERIFFHHLVGVYSVVKPGKMVPVDLIDVSEEGLAIQIPYQSETSWPTDTNNLPIRLYFSPENFIEVVVDIKNTHSTIESGTRYLRYGCAIQTEQRTFQAWVQFVGFLKAFSEVSEKDSGNISVGNY
jgi:hypothetical protein